MDIFPSPGRWAIWDYNVGIIIRDRYSQYFVGFETKFNLFAPTVGPRREPSRISQWMDILSCSPEQCCDLQNICTQGHYVASILQIPNHISGCNLQLEWCVFVAAISPFSSRRGQEATRFVQFSCWVFFSIAGTLATAEFWHSSLTPAVREFSVRRDQWDGDLWAREII